MGWVIYRISLYRSKLICSNPKLILLLINGRSLFSVIKARFDIARQKSLVFGDWNDFC